MVIWGIIRGDLGMVYTTQKRYLSHLSLRQLRKLHLSVCRSVNPSIYIYV